MTTVGGDQRHRSSNAEVSFTQDSEPIGQFDIQRYVNSLQSTDQYALPVRRLQVSGQPADTWRSGLGSKRFDGDLEWEGPSPDSVRKCSRPLVGSDELSAQKRQQPDSRPAARRTAQWPTPSACRVAIGGTVDLTEAAAAIARAAYAPGQGGERSAPKTCQRPPQAQHGAESRLVLSPWGPHARAHAGSKGVAYDADAG